MEKRCPRREINLIEALLFASGEPITAKEVTKVLSLPEEDCEKLIRHVKESYAQSEGGIQVMRMEDKYQMATNPAYYPQIEQLYVQKAQVKLTDVQLETLAIIVYQQPVTRQEISDIRGVQSDQVVQKLIQMELVEEAGRLKAPGRPILLKTTDAFLQAFKLESLNDLPELPKSKHDLEDVQLELKQPVQERLDLSLGERAPRKDNE